MMDDYQSRLNAWHKWNNQSSEYKMNTPEPPKPEPERLNSNEESGE